MSATSAPFSGLVPEFGTRRPRSGVLDNAVLIRAQTQFGVVSQRQLADDLGFSRSKLHRARKAGVLVDVAPGVVRIASSPTTFESRCMAAQLSTNETGFLSAWTAARLSGLRRMPDTPIHLTTATSSRVSAPGWVDVRRSRWFDAARDCRRLDNGLVVATPLRMLFGLAADFNQFRFERAAEDAWHLGLVTPEAAADYLERHRCRGKDGTSTMERWLERALTQGRPAQSGLEHDVLRAIEEAGLPTPVRQHPLRLRTGTTIHLDIAWPNIRLGVEPGASWWHGGDVGQRRDQARDRACGEVGWLIVRFDESVRRRRHEIGEQIREIHVRRTADLRNLE